VAATERDLQQTHGGNGDQQLTAMADARNPEFLKIVRGQMAQHFAADAILSECRLVALKTECSRQSPTSITAPQPAG
jgi:hypothetical protein